MSLNTIAGAIIAGGDSNRFGSKNKALAKLSDLTLIEHVYQRLATQTSRVWLNVPESLEVPKKLDVIRIADTPDLQNDTIVDNSSAKGSHKGPLCGVLSALIAASETNFEWLLIAPCDTPFIPTDLGDKFLRQCTQDECQLGIARSNGRNHPSLSLWHSSLLPSLKEAVLNHAKAGFKQFYPDSNHCFVEWQTDDFDPFLNINYPEDLEAAANIINNNIQLQPQH